MSDLRDITGLNRALNERTSGQVDLIRYHADPPVVSESIAEHTDLAVRSSQTGSDGPMQS